MIIYENLKFLWSVEVSEAECVRITPATFKDTLDCIGSINASEAECARSTPLEFYLTLSIAFRSIIPHMVLHFGFSLLG